MFFDMATLTGIIAALFLLITLFAVSWKKDRA